MRNARWEIPEIVFLHIGNETFAIGVDGSDAGAPIEHESPFGGGVPVEFANASCGEAHVDASHGFGDVEFANGDFARPPTMMKTLWPKEKGYLKGGTPPASVGGGLLPLGFCSSSNLLVGPGSLLLRS